MARSGGRGLIIDEIISRTEEIERQVRGWSLSDDAPLEIAGSTVQTARDARQRVRRWKSPFSLTRIRLYLFLAAVAGLAWWIFVNYFEPRDVRIALPAADSTLLQERARRSGSRHIRFIECRGSSEGLDLLREGKAELTVVQGGVPVPEEFDIIGIARREHVLYFVRTRPKPGEPQKVITFNRNQGSHILGRHFFRKWGRTDVEWIHIWGSLASETDPGEIPEAHAVFVVVDPADPGTMRGVGRVLRAGYRLVPPSLGAYAEHLPFLRRLEIPPGYYHLEEPNAPGEAGHWTYRVDNYLVASQAATDWERSEASRALGLRGEDDLASEVFHTQGTSLVGDVGALVEAAVNLVIILAALFGVEMLLHRRPLQELNSLISRISLLQAGRDSVGIREPERVDENMKVLGIFADLLGVISSISGYYGQENAPLLFNGQSGTIHSRANELKINIQLKLLQGVVMRRDFSEGEGTEPPVSTSE